MGVRTGRRLLVVSVVPLVATLLALVPIRAEAAAATVEVRDNFFTPDTLEIRSGDAVTWRVVDGDHTVRSEALVDGQPLFEFPAGPGTLQAGEEHTYVFEQPGTYGFFCEVHPGSMAGVIYVDTTPSRPVRTVPSPEFPTIAAALAGAPAGTTVEISPGTYPESLMVDAPDITLRGTGMDPDEVVLDGEGTRQTGVAVFGEGVRVENLTVRDYTARGLFLRGAHRFRVHDVVARDNGDHGIRTARSRGGGITDVEVTGSAVAGVSVADCNECGTLVERVTSVGNGTGVLVVNAGHVLILDSVVAANRRGIVVESAAPSPTGLSSGHLPPARGSTVRGNTLTANETGIAVLGSWHVRVDQNVIDGGDIGIAVRGAPIPVSDVAVTANTVGSYGLTGISWDLIGAGVCFSANRDAGAPDGAPRTDPPQLQALFPCRSA